MLQSLFLKFHFVHICYKYVRFVLQQKNFHIFSKKTCFFFLRKHDFSRKLEGGTGLQGVSSNLNVYVFCWGGGVLVFSRVWRCSSSLWPHSIQFSTVGRHSGSPPLTSPLPCRTAGGKAGGGKRHSQCKYYTPGFMPGFYHLV